MTTVTASAMILVSLAAVSAPAVDSAEASPLQWSVRMADAQMDRLGDSLVHGTGPRARWDYTSGIFADALLRLDEVLGTKRYQGFCEKSIGSYIDGDGTISTYRQEEYNLDHLAPGRALLRLHRLTGEDRYRLAAARLRAQLATQPRTVDGGYWHKRKYPWQMWLDGLYMAEPFVCEYAQTVDDRASYDGVIHQFLTAAAHTHAPANGLFSHGWDESRTQVWADRRNGRSSCFWGRSLGWFTMALADCLELVPPDHHRFGELADLYVRAIQGILNHADPATGLWYQVIDQGGRPGNYLESSCCCMFIASCAKGIRLGHLSPELIPRLRRTYASLLERFIGHDAEGRITLEWCCEVAGLSADRPGTFEYYVGERVVANDLKGVSPFILAGMELQRLRGQ